MKAAAQKKVKLHTQTYRLDDINQAIDDPNGVLTGRGIIVP